MLSLGIWSEAGEDGVTNGERFGVPAVSAISSVGSGLTLAGEMVILEGVKGETATKGSCSGATALPKFLASIVRREYDGKNGAYAYRKILQWGWTWFGLTAFLQKTARTGELLFVQSFGFVFVKFPKHFEFVWPLKEK